MDKRIIWGIVSGFILGGIEMLLLNGGYEFLIIAAIVGALIGFAKIKLTKVASPSSENVLDVPLEAAETKKTGCTYFIACALIGAALYLIIALFSGRIELILDDAITGAITGLLIGLITHFVSPK